ncbi:MAG TPA: hypothetical protein VFP98_05625, partial [Candidatus Polarisedimenticolia bacterium]|nr:hypothetical protein [Candidatus Polarisedimenticolia bacterium]
ELPLLLARMQAGPREAVIERKRRERDVQWLLDKLDRTPVHPDVVNALIALADPGVLQGAARLLLDETRPLAVRRAARYLLERALRRPIDVDPQVPLARQRQEVQRLREHLSRF